MTQIDNGPPTIPPTSPAPANSPVTATLPAPATSPAPVESFRSKIFVAAIPGVLALIPFVLSLIGIGPGILPWNHAESVFGEVKEPPIAGEHKVDSDAFVLITAQGALGSGEPLIEAQVKDSGEWRTVAWTSTRSNQGGSAMFPLRKGESWRVNVNPSDQAEIVKAFEFPLKVKPSR